MSNPFIGEVKIAIAAALHVAALNDSGAMIVGPSVTGL